MGYIKVMTRLLPGYNELEWVHTLPETEKMAGPKR